MRAITLFHVILGLCNYSINSWWHKLVIYGSLSKGRRSKQRGLDSRCVPSLFYSLARGLPVDTFKGKGCSVYGKDLNLSWIAHNTFLWSIPRNRCLSWTLYTEKFALLPFT